MRQAPKIRPGDKVPKTGVYSLDKGTRIVPVKQVRKMERGGRR